MASKDIHSLIRLKKWTVDEERRALAELLSQEAAVIRNQRMLEERVRREQAVAAADATGLAGRSYGAFARAAVDKRAKLEMARAEIEKAVAAQRDKVAEAFQDFKTLEQIQANRDRRAAIERGRKEQATMDEIAAINHRRRHGNGH
jgi:flagellar protein FliJ